MAGPDFHVEPPTLVVASAGFNDLQAWWSRIDKALGAAVLNQAGMIGDDEAGHSFNADYKTAAQAMLDGSDKLYGALGGMSNGLYRMAVNYTNTDADTAFDAMDKYTLPEWDEACDVDPATVPATVPELVHAAESTIIEVLRKFWPQGDPGKLRQAADDWRDLRKRLDELGPAGADLAKGVTDANHAQAVESFTGAWGKLWSNACLPGEAAQPLIETMQTSASALADACDSYATEIESLRSSLKQMAATAVVVTVADAALTIVTFGISDAVTVVVDGAVIVRAGLLFKSFLTAIRAAREVVEIRKIVGTVTAAMALLAVVTQVAATPTPTAAPTWGQADGIQDSVNGVNIETVLAASYGTSAGQGVPRDPASVYPPLSPQEQAEFRAWMAQMQAEGQTKTNRSTQAWNMYQNRVAGDTQFKLDSNVAGLRKNYSVWADGVRAEDGAAIEAKYAKNDECTTYSLKDSYDSMSGRYQNTLKQSVDELARYRGAVLSPDNPITHLELITNSPVSQAYFDELMREYDVPGETRLVP